MTPKTPSERGDFIADFTTRDMGKVYVYEDNESLVVKTLDDKIIGTIDYYLVECENSSHYRISGISLDGPDNTKLYLRQGIGSELVRILAKEWNFTLVVAQNDGLRLSDGSHLTGNAPAFWSSMHKKGYIYWDDYGE